MRSVSLFFVLYLAFVKCDGAFSFFGDSDNDLPKLRELFARIKSFISEKINNGFKTYVITRDNCTQDCPAICAKLAQEPFKDYCEISCMEMCPKILLRKYNEQTGTTENQRSDIKWAILNILAGFSSQAKIRKIDTNQDGFISLNELKTQTQDSLYLEAFELLNKDGDGMLTFGEYKKLKDIVEDLKNALKDSAEVSEESLSEELDGLIK